MKRSTRVSKPPVRFVLGQNYVADFVILIDCGEPSCYQEAMRMHDKRKWEKAMHLEMDSLIKNKTWDLMKLPTSKNALPCKWVYKIKVNPNVENKYKARLFAKGFKQ